MDATEIGILLSAIFWVKVIANPAIAALCDRRGERRRPIILLALGCLLSTALFAGATGFWALLAVSVLAGTFFSTMLPLGENLTMVTVYARGLDYGRIRLWGSLAFILAAAGAGRLLEGRSEGLVLWLILGALTVALAAAFALPDTRLPPAGSRRAPALRLLREPLFLVFLAAAGLVQASHAVYYGFATIHWRAAGLGDEIIGWLWAEGVAAEILLFMVSGRLVRRIGPAWLIALGAGAGLVRWLLMAETADLAILVAIQALHAASFGATHLGAMHFLTRAAPAEISATAQSLYSAIGGGVIFGLAMGASGALYDGLGAGAFHVMSGMALVGGAGACVLARTWDGGPLSRADQQSGRASASIFSNRASSTKSP